MFSALDRAQRALGFHHADLGMRNILVRSSRRSHALPPLPACPAKPSRNRQRPLAQEPALQPALRPPPPRAVTAAAHQSKPAPPLPSFTPPSPPPQQEHYPTLWSEVEGGEAAAAALPRRPGFTCNADGSRLPLGPEVEFKIIDYGLVSYGLTCARKP